MDDFTRGYLECALWTGMDESAEPLDKNYGLEDFDASAVKRAEEECERFEKENSAGLDAFYENLDDGTTIFPTSPDGDTAPAFAGHNFWLSRNGHGTGFWDRAAGEVGDRLHAAAKRAGGRDVYVGDDGKLYIS